MAKIAAKVVMFKAPVSVGSDEYTAHLKTAEFDPTQPTASWVDLDGKTTSFGGSSAWVCNLAGAQDWETANALSAWLNAHEGEEVEVTIGAPGGGSHTATCIAAAVKIGGTINTPAEWQKQLQVSSGAPEFTAGV